MATCRTARLFGALLLSLSSAGAAIGPKLVSQEQILAVTDEWIYSFDEDEDGKISTAEAAPLLAELREQSGMPAEGEGALTKELLMARADGNGDGLIDRDELVDLQMRMKGFEQGHLDRGRAQKPRAVNPEVTSYGKPHEQRMDEKKLKTKRPRKTKSQKDEV